MAKDESITVDTTEIHADDASSRSHRPILRQYATRTTQPDLVTHWPAEPHALVPEARAERWLLLYDLALCLIPVALITKAVLCIVAYVVDHNSTGYFIDEVHNLTIYLIRFNHQLTTVFTVVFILIISTLVRRTALYMAQEGATIAKLEQLQASISLPGTLKAMWSLRSFGRTSAILLVIWVWFYLGSQATTSEYELRSSGPFHKMPIAYFSDQKQSLFYSNSSTVQLSDNTISNINSFYNSFQTITSAKGGAPAYDLNGAALIPLLWPDGTTNGQGSTVLKRERHHWFDVSKASKVGYASNMGISVYTSYDNDTGNGGANSISGSFTLHTSYLNATCSENGVYNASSFPKGTISETQVSINVTNHALPSAMRPGDPPSIFEVWAHPNETGPTFSSSCYVRRVPVDLKVKCANGNCGATKMRFSPGLAQGNRTAFDNNNFTTTFFNNLLLANGQPGAPTSEGSIDNSVNSSVALSLIGGFQYLMFKISDPADSGHLTLEDVRAIDDAIMSKAMTIMINTYYQMSVDPSQGTWADDNEYGWDLESVLKFNSSLPDWTRGTAKAAYYNLQYRLSIPWVIVDLISCQILLAAAILSMCSANGLSHPTSSDTSPH